MATGATAIRTSVPVSASLIPVGSIHNLRDSFPGKTLVFEIDLITAGCWDGLETLAAIFSRAGLRLKPLRCNQAGVISCTVTDGGGDLQLLVRQLAQHEGISVTGWTTRIPYD